MKTISTPKKLLVTTSLFTAGLGRTTMHSLSKRLAAWIGFAVILSFSGFAHAIVIFTETWETPAIASGATSATLPSEWYLFSGTNSHIWYPENNTTRFNQADPLADPAGDNQILYLSGQNNGIYRMSGVFIEPDKTYTLIAAIGNDKLTTDDQYWSLQLWADTSLNGWFEGSLGNDSFIGQQFGTTTTAVNPQPGDWAINTFSFDSSTTPNLIGQQLVVFLNNFGSSATSFYDNVSLSAVPTQPAVPDPTIPEPASLALLGIGLVGMSIVRRRRRG